MTSTYFIRDPESFRNNVCQKISALGSKLAVEDIDRSRTWINIEKSIYNWTIREATFKQLVRIQWDNPLFVQLYIDRLRSVYMNLSTNPELMRRIESGELLPEHVGSMTHYEMNPERWDDIIEIKKKRDQSKYQMNLVANTDLYKCSKCKSTRCNYTTQQIRSADEAMTVFVTCLSCGKQWKC
jgi:DNA-directed RNA polymerase subunit M/transcription elongation factor TFIIS